MRERESIVQTMRVRLYCAFCGDREERESILREGYAFLQKLTSFLLAFRAKKKKKVLSKWAKAEYDICILQSWKETVIRLYF